MWTASRQSVSSWHRKAALSLLLVLISSGSATAQKDSVVQRRWVGTHLTQPLHLEFYGDTMLVVNDRYGVAFRITDDSIVAMGDTSFSVRYRISYGRLLLETDDGNVVTMSAQIPLARPLTGRWIGDLGTADGAGMELIILASGMARWRVLPAGTWNEGEWDRRSRVITLTWADESVWTGQYEPLGNAILFEKTLPESGAVVLRRTFR